MGGAGFTPEQIALAEAEFEKRLVSEDGAVCAPCHPDMGGDASVHASTWALHIVQGPPSDHRQAEPLVSTTIPPLFACSRRRA